MQMHRILIVLLVLCSGVMAQEKVLSGSYESKHFVVRYRPGSRAGAEVERTAALAEHHLVKICERLGLKPKGNYEIGLYDDLDDLAATTGVTGTGGFSSERTSHVPVGNDQTLAHELVHIIAYDRLRKAGDEARNLFFAEGLANAYLEYVHGVPVHAVAAFYLKRKALPSLEEITGTADFYAWLQAHAGFNAYDVAGSYMLFLLDTFSTDKALRYYMGLPAKQAFGTDLADLEKRWHRHLEKFNLRPEVELLLAQRHGEGANSMIAAKAGIPAEILGKPSDWTSMAGKKLRPANKASWNWEGETLVGNCPDATWSVCEIGDNSWEDCAVRTTILTDSPIPLQVRLGAGNQAMLVNGTFLYRREQPHASSQKAGLNAGRKKTDFLLIRRKARIEIWIDGVLALETDAEPGPDPVALGFHGGQVTFSDIVVRPLQ